MRLCPRSFTNAWPWTSPQPYQKLTHDVLPRSHHRYEKQRSQHDLGGGFKHFLFSPLFGEDSHFDSYFSKGLKPPTSDIWIKDVRLIHYIFKYMLSLTFYIEGVDKDLFTYQTTTAKILFIASVRNRHLSDPKVLRPWNPMVFPLKLRHNHTSQILVYTLHTDFVSFLHSQVIFLPGV